MLTSRVDLKWARNQKNLSIDLGWRETEKELQRTNDDPKRKVFHIASRFTHIFLGEFGENAASQQGIV